MAWVEPLSRLLLLFAFALALSLAGCGGGGGDEQGATTECDDAAFRAQDEELYVAQVTVANAIGGGGDPATLLLDLRRARTALADYLDRNRPCDAALLAISTTEREAVSALDEAVAALEEGADAKAPLGRALSALETAQQELSGSP